MSHGGETKFWRKDLQVAFKALGDYDRIESHDVSIGRPDINICLSGGVVWDIELKYSDTNTTRLRPSQRGWFFRRRRVGGNCAVFTKWVRPNETLYLFNLQFPDDDNMQDWADYAEVIWEGKIDWNELEEILRAKK